MRKLLVFVILAPLSACNGSDSQVAGDGGPDTPDAHLDGDGSPLPPVDAAVPDAVPPTLVCTDGTGAFASIQAAVDAAADGDRIELCAVTFRENVTVAGKMLTILAAGPGAAIDGGGSAPALAVTGGAEVTVIGVHLTDGRPAVRCDEATLSLEDGVVDASSFDTGGGVHAQGCVLALARMEVTGNSANYGGGVWISGGSLTIDETTIADNTGLVHGGGIWIGGEAEGRMAGSQVVGNHCENKGGGIFILGASPEVVETRFAMNTSLADGAGGHVDTSSSLFSDCIFEDNASADDAGGLRLHHATITVERASFLRNIAAGDGGAVKASHEKSAFIDCVFEDNEAAGWGGGIEVDDDQSSIVGSAFRRNQASRGGGIHGSLIGMSEGWEDLIVEDNTAVGYGGGIMLEVNEGFVPMKRIVLDGNSADRGGNFAVLTTEFSLDASLLVGGDADTSGGNFYVGDGANGTMSFVTASGGASPTGAGLRVRNATLVIGSSIILGNVAKEGGSLSWSYSDAWNGSFTGASNPSGAGGNISSNPLFVDEAAGDHHLAAGSPAVNAGDPAVTDGDGSRADMGAYGGPEAL